MSKQIEIQDSIVISRSWLEKEKEHWEGLVDHDHPGRADIILGVIEMVMEQSTPSAPVVEKAFDAGCIETERTPVEASSLLERKQQFLNGKIEVE